MSILPIRERMHSSWLSVDIETLDVVPTAVPLSIGAVIYDPYEEDSFEDLRRRAFYVNIDRADAERHGCTTSESTLAWWKQQSTAAWDALQVNPKPLREALQAFIKYVEDHSSMISAIVAKSPSFDCVILQSAMRAVGLRWPWPFYIERDHRTWMDAAFPQYYKPDFLNGRVAHDARDDAVAQAMDVQRAVKVLRPLWAVPFPDEAA